MGEEARFEAIFGDLRAVQRLGEIGRYPLQVRNAAVLALKVARRAGAAVVTPEAVELVGKD